MSNTFANLTNAVGRLKIWYAGPIVTQFNDEMPLYREIEKGKEKFSGQQVNRPLKVRRNQGIGATSDGGSLPSIGKQLTTQAQITARYNYLRFGITGPLMKAAQGDKGAFVSGLTYEMEEGMNDLKNDVNRQLYWDGSGDLAVVSAAASSSNVITVTGRESTEDGNKFLDVGMVVDIVDGTAGTVKVSSVSISALSGTTTATLTLDQAVTVAANDIVVRTGALDVEIQGLLTTLDGGTSTIYNIDRSTYLTYQGNAVSNSSAAMDLDFLKEGYNEMRRRGGGKLGHICSDFDSERMYEKLLVADKRYAFGAQKLKGDGTFSSKDMAYLEYAGVPWVADKDAPQRVFMLDPRTWKKYVLSELEWADESGAPLIAQTDADSYEARLRLFCNLFCEKPSANVALSSYVSP